MNATEIRTRFDRHFLEVVGENRFLAVASPPKDQWDEFPTDPPEGWPTVRFGWLPPMPYEDEDPNSEVKLLVSYCPELIAEQLEGLQPEQVEHYLDALEFVLDMHIHHIRMPIEIRTEMIDSQLYDVSAGSMVLLNEVQMRALDHN